MHLLFQHGNQMLQALEDVLGLCRGILDLHQLLHFRHLIAENWEEFHRRPERIAFETSIRMRTRAGMNGKAAIPIGKRLLDHVAHPENIVIDASALLIQGRHFAAAQIVKSKVFLLLPFFLHGTITERHVDCAMMHELLDG